MPFTEKQRKWFFRRAGGKCESEILPPGGRKKRCGSRKDLVVCHIFPPGWCKTWRPGWNDDGPNNGIVLCGSCMALRFHDWRAAHGRYVDGDRSAFKKMAAQRVISTKRGKTYWDTSFDLRFIRIARRETARHLARHRKDQYPYRRKPRRRKKSAA